METYNSSSATTQSIFRANQVVWYILGVLEVILLFRFLLKLFAANPAAGFTDFIYSITQPLVAPFLSVFRISSVEGSIFEWTTLLALFVYWLVATGIMQLLAMSRTVSTHEARKVLEVQDEQT